MTKIPLGTEHLLTRQRLLTTSSIKTSCNVVYCNSVTQDQTSTVILRQILILDQCHWSILVQIYMYSSHLGLTGDYLLKLVVCDEDYPSEGDPHHERQQQAGVGHGQVGAPGKTLRGHLDESLLHRTHFRPDDWG